MISSTSANVAEHSDIMCPRFTAGNFETLRASRAYPKRGRSALRNVMNSKSSNDEAAAVAAKKDGIDCGDEWPFFVSPDGLQTWKKLIGDDE